MIDPLDDLHQLLNKFERGALDSLWLPWLGQASKAMGELLRLLDEDTVAQALDDFNYADEKDRSLMLALLHDLLERSAEAWQEQAEKAVERGGANSEDWQELLQSLGEHDLSLWSAFLTFVQDLDAILWMGDDEEIENPAELTENDKIASETKRLRQTLLELALWSQNLHAAVAELKNNERSQNAEAIAHALQREIWQQQRQALLNLLPT